MAARSAGLTGSLSGYAPNLSLEPKTASSSNSSASENDAVTIRPVVTASGGVDLWCTPELTHGDHECFVKESAAIQVFDQRGKGLVSGRDQVIFEPAKDVGMGVPVSVLSIVLAVVNSDKSHASLNESASQENTLSQFIATITVTQFRVFRPKVKCATNSRRV